MINGIQPSFTGRVPLKTGKTVKKALNKVAEQPSITDTPKKKTPALKNFAKKFFDDMLYGFEMLADTFKIKL